MGFGKKFKTAVGAVANAIPGANQAINTISGLPGGDPIGGVTLGILKSGVDQTARDKAGAAQMEDALSQQQAATAEQARLKLIADESVKAQEELARKKTVFGGDAQQQTLERRKLLGI